MLVPVPIEADSSVVPPFQPAPPEADLLDIQVEDTTEIENEVGAEEPASGTKEYLFCSSRVDRLHIFYVGTPCFVKRLSSVSYSLFQPYF